MNPRTSRKRLSAKLLVLPVAVAAHAHAVVPSAPLASATAPSSTATTAPNPRFCKETLPEGRVRPKLTESVPDRISAGYALELVVTVAHEARETVMPGGTEFQLHHDDAAALAKEGFVLPSPKGPSKMRVEANPNGSPPTTKVTLPLLVLPKEPGKTTLTLPSLPITIARSNGEIFTLCTEPHNVVVEDPTANTPEAKPKGNPPGRRQIEEWTSLKQGLQILAIALVAGAVFASLFLLWRRRPRKLPPPPPPRPPWEVAIEELAHIRSEDLIHQQRFAEHYDRVSDTVRKYLGARFGFDGLESTTKEMLQALRQAHLELGTLSVVELFLRDADLVKFAKRTPTEAECVIALEQAEGFVRSTLPAQSTESTSPEQTATDGGKA